MPDEVLSISLISDLLSNIEREINAGGDYKVSFEKMWLVKTQSKDVDDSKLPYIPHFDKRRYLKGMIYLNDVGYGDGPIHLSPIIDDAIDIRRKSLPLDYKSKGLNSVVLKNEDIPRPIIGNAGMLILFDTNAPHHAGLVQPNRTRKVLRFDFEDPCWNKEGMAKRFLSKLKFVDIF
jgi:hypothetical protein